MLLIVGDPRNLNGPGLVIEVAEWRPVVGRQSARLAVHNYVHEPSPEGRA